MFSSTQMLPDVSIIGRMIRSDLNAISRGVQQYSWIVGTFQGAIIVQPICGSVGAEILWNVVKVQLPVEV
jgi:hypothetical protein